MAKRDDLEDRIHAIENKQATDDGFRAGFWKAIMVCITATGSFLSFCVWLGGLIYYKVGAVKVGILAALAELQNK